MLYKTKAVRKPVILKSTSALSRGDLGYTMSMATLHKFSPIYKHGWGVDIDELIEIINQSQT